jgi:hypothetical protein
LADNVERGEILQLLVWMTMGWSLFIWSCATNYFLCAKRVSMIYRTTIGAVETPCCKDIGIIGNKKNQEPMFLWTNNLMFSTTLTQFVCQFMMLMTIHKCKGFDSTYSLR